MTSDAATFTARLLTGAVLLVAGVGKLRAPSNHFLKAILGYDLLPMPLANVIARTLPWVEVVVALMLIAGLGSRIAVFLGFGLLLAFSSAIAISLLRGKHQHCGCFDSLTPVQWRLVYRNLILMALLLPVHAFSGGRWSLDNLLTSQLSGDGLFSIELAALSITWVAILGTTLLVQQLSRKTPAQVIDS